MSNPNEPTFPSDSTPPPDQKPKDTGADWRVLLILGVVVLFLAGVYINKKYYSKPKPEQEPPTPEMQNLSQPEQPQLSPAEQYAALLERSRTETRNYMFSAAPRMLFLARPPMFVPGAEGEPPSIALGVMFDVTECAKGVEPEEFLRRAFYGDSEAHFAFMDSFQPMGISGDVKMVITPASEVKLDVLSDTEMVIGVSVDGAARAYPLKFANYHDVINDTLAEKPIVVVWSAVAGAATALERTLSDGETLVFGSAGLVYQSAIMMYDKADSPSLWSPTVRRCLAGPRVGAELVPIEARVVSWREWKRLYPETSAWTATDPVLPLDYGRSPATPRGYFGPGYGIIYPVEGYDVEKTPLAVKYLVAGVTTSNGATKAYAMHLVAQQKEPFEDRVGDVTLKLTFDKAAGILNAETSDGSKCLVEQMFWVAWFGAHPETEVWREAELLAQMHPEEQAAEVPGTTTSTTLAEPVTE